MNLNIDQTNNRQITVRNTLRKLSLNTPLTPSPDGSVRIETLQLYIEHEGNRVLNGTITLGTFNSYVSELSNIHLTNRVQWNHIINDPLVSHQLRRIRKNQNNPVHETRQDYALSQSELLKFVKSLDTKVYSEIVAGALASTLFWSITRIPELLHAEKHPRMTLRCITKYKLPGNGTAFKILLERPKIVKAFSQYSTPVPAFDATNPSTWLTRLDLFRPATFTSPWQLSQTTHANSNWLLTMLSDRLQITRSSLGPCSFRSGGFCHLLSVGHDFNLLCALGRWDSNAVDRYLRSHPTVLIQALASKTSLHLSRAGITSYDLDSTALQ
jgi:hypothetical protein